MSSREKLEERCRTSGLEIVQEYDEETHSGGEFIRDLTATGKWILPLTGDLDDETLLATRFENCRPTSKYDGMWSASQGLVECELICEQPFFPGDNLLTRLAIAAGVEKGRSGAPEFRAEVPVERGAVHVSIGWMSPELKVWRCASRAVHLLDPAAQLPSIQVRGIRCASEIEAVRILESFGVAALLQLDDAGFKARLREEVPFLLDFTAGKSHSPIKPISRAPPIEAVSLYWQGRFAATLPEAFLGYYQTLEYFFAEGPPGAKRPPEQAMLESLFRTIPDAQLRSAIEGDSRLLKHYRHSLQGIVKERIDVELPGSDLCKQAAARLYKIRCRLVHTKSYAQVPVFLPLSAEAVELRNDTVLIRELARRVLTRRSVELPAP